jgi:hypothetical protein
MAIPGESGKKLRNQTISDGGATIRALHGILECDRCRHEEVLRAFATEILLDLSCVDTSSIVTCARQGGVIIPELLRIFVESYSQNELQLFRNLYSSKHWMKKRSYIRNLAGELLVRLSSQSETSATVILLSGVCAPHDLTNILVCAKNNTSRMRAAELLERLCRGDYTNDDYYLESLQEAVLSAMAKVKSSCFIYMYTGE